MIRPATRRLAVPTAFAILPPLAADVHAQRCLEVDGIELRTSARVVEYGAGTRSVSE